VLGSPAIQAPTVGQTHLLSAANLATAPPAVGSPTFASTHVLAANGIATSSPLILSPTLVQTHILTAGNIATSSPLVTNINFSQPQRLNIRPLSDVSAGGWTNESGGSTLYTSIDEVDPSDADYIQSPTSPHINIARMKLETPAFGLAPPVLVSYRYQKDETVQTGVANLTVRLMQGSTTIASWTHNNIPATMQGVMQTLTQPQMDAITNAANLYVEFEANT